MFFNPSGQNNYKIRFLRSSMPNFNESFGQMLYEILTKVLHRPTANDLLPFK